MMLGEAARELGIDCQFLDPTAEPPAASVGDVIQAPYDDPAALHALCSDADVITYEFENVPVDGLRTLPPEMPVYPPLNALRKAQDRLLEKHLFEQLDIPTSPFRNVESSDDATAAGEELGLPLVFKTRRFGYDGKGQAVVRSQTELETVFDELGQVPLIAEQLVNFDCEVSIFGARRPSGDVVHWPLSENRHAGGILRVSRAPYDDPQLFELATTYHRRMLDELDYVGVLTLEMFVVGDRLVANEFAPRVHNSGHWTIEGSETSQFTNHIRAVLDQPLGVTDMRGAAAMVNLIGHIPEAVATLKDPDICFHDYGKAPRAGRKLAHLTLVCDQKSSRDARLKALSETLSTD